jgi:mannan endo-1,4-beta-mannosidase
LVVVGAALLLNACAGWQLTGSSAPTTLPKNLPKIEPTHEPSAVFLLDGEPLCFVGTNQYYLTWKSEEMLDQVFQNARDIGVKVLRHWGHLEMGSRDGAVPHVKGDGTKEGVYFSYWDTERGRPAYNDGKNGLERLDLLIKKAREAGIKLVLTLTNNWPDFGGMDQYLIWYGLDKHYEFYTDTRVRQAYKDWVEHVIGRVNSLTGVLYRDDPTIFAWELANEPRIKNHTKSDSATGWDSTTITKWAEEMTDYIRSLDPNHMIAVGDEGMFSHGASPFYDGAEGIDHQALLAIEGIDYGTFHLYPDHWGTSLSWADTWIEDHIVAARMLNKPTVLEEYGAMVERDDKTGEINGKWQFREGRYRRWNDLILLRGGAGAMFWMIAGYDDTTKRNYTDWDRFTVYDVKGDPTARLLAGYGRRMMTEARACQLATNVVPKRRVPAGFVTTSRVAGAARLASLPPGGRAFSD